MKDGEVIESGTHEELFNLNGYYSQLCRIQGMSDEVDELKEKEIEEVKNEIKSDLEEETKMYSSDEEQEKNVFRQEGFKISNQLFFNLTFGGSCAT